MTAALSPPSSRTLACPGVCPGVGSSQISLEIRWSIATRSARPASRTGFTLSAMMRAVSGSGSADQCSHSRFAKR